MDFLDPARPILLQFCWRFGVCSCGEMVCSFPLWLSSSNLDIGKYCILDKLVNSLVPILWVIMKIWFISLKNWSACFTWEFSAVWKKPLDPLFLVNIFPEIRVPYHHKRQVQRLFIVISFMSIVSTETRVIPLLSLLTSSFLTFAFQ